MLKESALINHCYILREKLKGDSFCEIWRTSAVFAASDFMIRILKPEYSGDQEKNEAFVVDALRSRDAAAPSVLPLIEIDRIEGRPFVVSEYERYTDLRSELDGGFSVTMEHACRLVIELAEGIDAFHQKGIPYGALSPESVVVRKSGGGIDEIKIQKPSYWTLFAGIPDERIGDIRSSWGYAAPELKRGEAPDPRSDLYSLGIMLYRLVVGKLPYGTRSGLRIKERSASPGHVAASLARRSVPRELAAIAVRALRKSPRHRYQDTVSLIADLYRFLDLRRETNLRSGGADPIADLATLNLKKAKAGAHEITRSLDTADYFRLLSEAAVSAPNRHEIMKKLKAFEPTEAVEELEESEAEGEEDDDSRDVESYIIEGYAKAETERRPEKKTAAEPFTAPESAPAPDVVSDLQPGTGLRISPEEEQPILPENERLVPSEKEQPVPSEEKQASPPQTRPKRVRERRRGVGWRRTRGTPEEIAAELRRTFERMKRGRGSLRFIEDPVQGGAAETIRKTLESFKDTALFVELGTLPKTSMAEAGLVVLTAMRKGAENEEEPRRSELSRKLSELGPWNGTAEYLIQCVRILAGKKRPLVIVGEEVESIDRSFHPFIARLAEIASHVPFCAVFFYRNREVEPWHALSSLAALEPSPITPNRN